MYVNIFISLYSIAHGPDSLLYDNKEQQLVTDQPFIFINEKNFKIKSPLRAEVGSLVIQDG